MICKTHLCYNGILSSGNIKIEGGIITATGGELGAGIGGGSNITISGGTIETTGAILAAGIGSGNYGTCGNISITGGTVTATGGELGAGIGGGTFGVCGNITIASTITKVTATHGGIGEKAYTTPYSIGVGSESDDYMDSNEELIKNKYGTITFDNVKFTPTWQQGTESNPHGNKWTYDPEPTDGTNYGGLKLTISDKTWTLVPTTTP